jgi:hypothetical protein
MEDPVEDIRSRGAPLVIGVTTIPNGLDILGGTWTGMNVNRWVPMARMLLPQCVV